MPENDNVFIDHTGQHHCLRCGAWIQRAVDGTLADGIALHYRVLHPGEPVPHG